MFNNIPRNPDTFYLSLVLPSEVNQCFFIYSCVSVCFVDVTACSDRTVAKFKLIVEYYMYFTGTYIAKIKIIYIKNPSYSTKTN